MSTDPTLAARLSHREGLWLRNANLSSGSGNDLFCSRVQSAEPQATHNATKHYQIGDTSATGVTTDPTDYRFTFQENMHNSEIDMYLAGVASSGSGFYAANLVNQDLTAYLVRRNNNDSVDEEVSIETCRVTEMVYTFVLNGPCTVDYTLMGTSGSYYRVTGSYVHPLWGSFDSTSPGGVGGKDARIAFGSNVVGSKAYRLQRFVVRATYPDNPVGELGRRALVGRLADSPDVTVEFDLLPADYQPHDVFFPVSNDGGVAKYALSQPQTSDVYINLYDPDEAESATILKSFAIPNCKPTQNSPASARVRQITTPRWSLTNQSEGSSKGTGGLLVSKTELTAT